MQAGSGMRQDLFFAVRQMVGGANPMNRSLQELHFSSALLLLTSHTTAFTLLCTPHRGRVVMEGRSPILQGTLDLMVLKTLEQLGPLHGYGIARRIEQVGQDALIVNQGTIYLCLVRLMQKRWIAARWGTSENNRKARFYSITEAGRAQLKAETENWTRISGVIGRVLQPE
jgi:transcriptional regulator